MSDEGFDAFYRDSYRQVVVALRLATGSTELAEDLAQDAFARTLVRWSRVRHGTNPAGYVYRVAFRLHHRSLRRWRRQHDAAVAAAQHRSREGTTPPAELWGEVAAVHEIFARLPARRRRAAALCLYAGLTAEEAGAALGMSASTVRTHVQRARQALTPVLSRDAPEPAAADPAAARERTTTPP